MRLVLVFSFSALLTGCFGLYIQPTDPIGTAHSISRTTLTGASSLKESSFSRHTQSLKPFAAAAEEEQAQILLKMERDFARLVKEAEKALNSLQVKKELPYALPRGVPSKPAVLRLIPTKDVVANAVVESSSIEISYGFVSRVFEFVQAEKDSNDGEGFADISGGEAFADVPGGSFAKYGFEHLDRMLTRTANMTLDVEYNDVMRFVIAHELAHIWFDADGEQRIDQEIRADAIGAVVSTELSKAAQFKYRMQKNMADQAKRSGRVKLKLTEGQLVFLNARTGIELLEDIYSDLKIPHQSLSHMPWSDRKQKVTAAIEKLIETKAERSSSLRATAFLFLGI